MLCVYSLLGDVRETSRQGTNAANPLQLPQRVPASASAYYSFLSRNRNRTTPVAATTTTAATIPDEFLDFEDEVVNSLPAVRQSDEVPAEPEAPLELLEDSFEENDSYDYETEEPITTTSTATSTSTTSQTTTTRTTTTRPRTTATSTSTTSQTTTARATTTRPRTTATTTRQSTTLRLVTNQTRIQVSTPRTVNLTITQSVTNASTLNNTTDSPVLTLRPTVRLTTTPLSSTTSAPLRSVSTSQSTAPAVRSSVATIFVTSTTTTTASPVVIDSRADETTTATTTTTQRIVTPLRFFTERPLPNVGVGNGLLRTGSAAITVGAVSAAYMAALLFLPFGKRKRRSVSDSGSNQHSSDKIMTYLNRDW